MESYQKKSKTSIAASFLLSVFSHFISIRQFNAFAVRASVGNSHQGLGFGRHQSKITVLHKSPSTQDNKKTTNNKNHIF
jgi:hypothetical protein